VSKAEIRYKVNIVWGRKTTGGKAYIFVLGISSYLPGCLLRLKRIARISYTAEGGHRLFLPEIPSSFNLKIIILTVTKE
jgi:hypothetical protein